MKPTVCISTFSVVCIYKAESFLGAHSVLARHFCFPVHSLFRYFTGEPSKGAILQFV